MNQNQKWDIHVTFPVTKAPKKTFFPAPGKERPGEFKLRLFHGGTEFIEDTDQETGILEVNPDYDPSTGSSNPDPTKRYPYKLIPGFFREIDFEDSFQINSDPNFWWTHYHADSLPISKQLEIAAAPYRPKYPNWVLSLHRKGDQKVAKKISQITTNSKNQLNGYFPSTAEGCFFSTEKNQIIDPNGDECHKNFLPTFFWRQLSEGGFYLRYEENYEAMGGVGTSNLGPGGAIQAGSEIDQFEDVRDIFFLDFDLSDTNNFRVTKNPYYNGEIVSAPLIFVGKKRTAQWDVYLIPRKWYYYFRFLAVYGVFTLFTSWYMYVAYAGSFYDQPPVYPVEYQQLQAWNLGGFNYEPGTHWKLTHSKAFLTAVSEAQDFGVSTPFFAIIWVANTDHYMRVRCAPAKPGELCAVIRDRTTRQTFYIWRTTGEKMKDAEGNYTDEDRPFITLVDTMFLV